MPGDHCPCSCGRGPDVDLHRYVTLDDEAPAGVLRAPAGADRHGRFPPTDSGRAATMVGEDAAQDEDPGERNERFAPSQCASGRSMVTR